jgi:glycosyltransferase involved in cell wall biosynthesis
MQISVVMPARNEGARAADTIRAMAAARADPRQPVEFVVVDDASDPPLVLGNIDMQEVTVRLIRSEGRLGVPASRNLAAAEATGDVLVITDAHVRFGDGWDLVARVCLDSPLVLAATIADPTSRFRGHGCSLVVPFMGTRWNKHPHSPGDPVHIPSCAGTLLSHATYDAIGGYDDGMVLYGGAEPEFGLRAWLSGHAVLAVPDLLVWHRFKTPDEIGTFLDGLRPALTHNSMRMGALYLPEGLLWQMFRYHANLHPETFPEALRMLEVSDVWRRKEELRSRFPRDFTWFTHTFGLVDQIGRALKDPIPA